MGSDPDEVSEREARVNEVVPEYLRGVGAGRAPDRAELLAGHPDLADELAEYFRDRDRIEGWLGPLGEGKATILSPETRPCPHCRAPLQATAAEAFCLGCGARFRLDGAAPLPMPAGQRLGRFELLAEVGRGGFGVVYRARDPGLDRDVALKVPRAGSMIDPDERARFLQEGRHQARLRHPGIVPVHEAGEADGVPYIVSEFVEGRTLAALLRDHRPPPERAAALLAEVADALHYAHGAGLVHRDVKPSNILLGPDGRPFLTDFGLALGDVGEPTLTPDSQVLGTPAYMGPEQARGDAARGDGRCDVYSLGVVLYQMLTGQTPFAGPARMILHQVLHDEPSPPRRLNDRLPRDLETICLKAMAKAPARRYGTAGELADDLRRFLRGEPVRARPVGRWERLRSWGRRNPSLAAAVGLAAVLLVTATAVSVGWAVHAGRLADNLAGALDESEQARRRTQEQLSERLFDRALDQCERGEVGLGLLGMARALETAPDGAEELCEALRASLASWEPGVFPLTGCHAAPGDVLALDPGGGSAWVTEPDGSLRRHDLTTGAPVGPPLRQEGKITAAAASRDGDLVVTAAGSVALLWEAAAGKLVRPFVASGLIDAVAFGPDGRTVLTAERPKEGSPDPGATIRLWDARTGERLSPPYHTEGTTAALALSPDGRTVLAARSGAWAVSAWDREGGQSRGPLPLPRGEHQALAFSPDGRGLLTGSADYTARLWDPATGRALSPPLHHGGRLRAVAFRRDGRALLTADAHNTVRTWAVTEGPAPDLVLAHHWPVRTVAFSLDGETVATGSMDRTARLWTRQQGTLLRELSHESQVAVVLFSPDGRTLLTADWKDSARLWDAATGQPLGKPFRHGRWVHALAFSGDGRLAVRGSYDGTAVVWDVAAGAPLATFKPGGGVVAVAFDPAGARVVTGSTDGTARVWESATGRPWGEPLSHGCSVRAVAFSREGDRVLTAGVDGTARLWDAATGRPVGALMEHGGEVWAAAFSPDGRRIVTGSWDGTARLWDGATGQPRSQPLAHEGPVWAVAVSPDGRRVATASLDRTARLWDASTGRPLGPPLRHPGEVWAVAFDPGGRAVLTGCGDHKGRLWPLPAPLGGSVERVVLRAQVHTGMELDAGGGFHVLDPPTWQQRRQRLDAR
jgi:WD40 repeat protein